MDKKCFDTSGLLVTIHDDTTVEIKVVADGKIIYITAKELESIYNFLQVVRLNRAAENYARRQKSPLKDLSKK